MAAGYSHYCNYFTHVMDMHKFWKLLLSLNSSNGCLHLLPRLPVPSTFLPIRKLSESSRNHTIKWLRLIVMIVIISLTLWTCIKIPSSENLEQFDATSPPGYVTCWGNTALFDLLGKLNRQWNTVFCDRI